MKSFIKIKKIDEDQYEIVIDNGIPRLKEFDFFKINGDNFYLKTYRVGEFYTKDNGSMDATLAVKQYEFLLDDIVDFAMDFSKKPTELRLTLKNEIINLVKVPNLEHHDDNFTKLSFLLITGKI